MTRRIMAAAEQELRALERRRFETRGFTPSRATRWWKPAAALALAATVLLLSLMRPPGLAESQPESILLRLVASDGDPVSLWNSLGIQADPVLALIAIQEREAETEPPTPPAARRMEEIR
jgi:hypothetical protein